MPVRAARTAPAAGVPVYQVSLRSPAGPAELEVPSCAGAATTRRRAVDAAAALGWGEPPAVQVTATELLPATPPPVKAEPTLAPARSGQLVIPLHVSDSRSHRVETAGTD